MLSYVAAHDCPVHQIFRPKPVYRVPSTLHANQLDFSIILEDNICQFQDLGNDEEYESERRILCKVKPARPCSQPQFTFPNQRLPLCCPCQGLSEYTKFPESIPARSAYNADEIIGTHIIEFRKRRVGTHPAQAAFIERFRLDDPDYQIDNGKLLKTDQLAKNVLRWMTRHDKRLIQLRSQPQKSKQLDIETQYRHIYAYFSSEYSIQDFSNFDLNMMCTLFAPLKIREQRLKKESSDETCASPGGGKKKPFIVKDRLELFSGDVDRTSQFFRKDPGRTIYFSSFKNVFRIYIRTLLEMNLRKRSQGFQKFINQVEERMKN